MKKTKSLKHEFEAEIRNKITLPLTVLDSIHEGKKVSKKNIGLAVRDLEEIKTLLMQRKISSIFI